jgi:hypothetical protein
MWLRGEPVAAIASEHGCASGKLRRNRQPSASQQRQPGPRLARDGRVPRMWWAVPTWFRLAGAEPSTRHCPICLSKRFPTA